MLENFSDPIFGNDDIRAVFSYNKIQKDAIINDPDVPEGGIVQETAKRATEITSPTNIKKYQPYILELLKSGSISDFFQKHKNLSVEDIHIIFALAAEQILHNYPEVSPFPERPFSETFLAVVGSAPDGSSYDWHYNPKLENDSGFRIGNPNCPNALAVLAMEEGLIKGKNILELGAGTGFDATYMLSTGRANEVRAVEQNPFAVEAFTRRKLALPSSVGDALHIYPENALMALDTLRNQNITPEIVYSFSLYQLFLDNELETLVKKIYDILPYGGEMLTGLKTKDVLLNKGIEAGFLIEKDEHDSLIIAGQDRIRRVFREINFIKDKLSKIFSKVYIKQVQVDNYGLRHQRVKKPFIFIRCIK